MKRVLLGVGYGGRCTCVHRFRESRDGESGIKSRQIRNFAVTFGAAGCWVVGATQGAVYTLSSVPVQDGHVVPNLRRVLGVFWCFFLLKNATCGRVVNFLKRLACMLVLII